MAFRRLALAAALFAAAMAGSPATAAGPAAQAGASGALPDGAQYFRLDPFTVPVMSRTEVVRHLTFILTLELASERMRPKVQSRLPVLRHALNTGLLRMVGVARPDDSLPPLAAIKGRLLAITRDVTGPDVVRAVLVESVYERRLR